MGGMLQMRRRVVGCGGECDTSGGGWPSASAPRAMALSHTPLADLREADRHLRGHHAANYRLLQGGPCGEAQRPPQRYRCPDLHGCISTALFTPSLPEGSKLPAAPALIQRHAALLLHLLTLCGFCRTLMRAPWCKMTTEC
jgi:hypothetical protein